MNNVRTYVYVVIGCILGAIAGASTGGLGIGVGIACGAGVGVALASRATCTGARDPRCRDERSAGTGGSGHRDSRASRDQSS
jgi:hypothetical protein